MTSHLEFRKVKPADVVRQALAALDAGRPEVLVDDMTRQVKSGLSVEPGIYLDFGAREGTPGAPRAQDARRYPA
ncbi:MAG TPA: hypothetical protein VFX20_11145 [Steroidobacteraceae bacterium]|nr:hypothetical protein [Steroidobacteraceae bacterium]